MFATFVCRNSANITKSAVTAGIHLKKFNGPSDIIVRRMAGPVRSGKIRKAQRTRSLGEIAIAPAGTGGIHYSCVMLSPFK
jgi:hypothetical protein